MIYSSVNLVLFISSVLLMGPGSNQNWRKLRGALNAIEVAAYSFGTETR
jgi:hypothetical protein